MDYLINESTRRRAIQEKYNADNRITPTTVYKSTDDIIGSTAVADSIHEPEQAPYKSRKGDDFSEMDKKLAVDMMRQEMFEAAENLDFERAANLRDEISKIEKELAKAF